MRCAESCTIALAFVTRQCIQPVSIAWLWYMKCLLQRSSVQCNAVVYASVHSVRPVMAVPGVYGLSQAQCHCASVAGVSRQPTVCAQACSEARVSAMQSARVHSSAGTSCSYASASVHKRACTRDIYLSREQIQQPAWQLSTLCPRPPFSDGGRGLSPCQSASILGSLDGSNRPRESTPYEHAPEAPGTAEARTRVQSRAHPSARPPQTSPICRPRALMALAQLQLGNQAREHYCLVVNGASQLSQHGLV